MISNNDLVLINDNYKNEVENIIAEAIKGNIQLFIMDEQRNQFHKLTSGDIHKIKSIHPAKATVYLRKPEYKEISGRKILVSLGQWQEVGYSELWGNEIAINNLKIDPKLINKIKEEEVLSNREKQTLLKIIQIMTKIIAANSKTNPGLWRGEKINASKVAEKICNQITNENGRYPQDLSLENVRKKISEALDLEICEEEPE